MLDWFVILTPILLMPIALLVLFVGCSLIFTIDTSSKVTFDLTFYVTNDRLSHSFFFEVFSSMEPLDDSETDNIMVVDGGGGNNTSQVTHRFSLILEANPVTLSCTVTDTTTGEPLVSGGTDCEHTFKAAEDYFVLFEAGVSADGTTPSEEFGPCSFGVV